MAVNENKLSNYPIPVFVEQTEIILEQMKKGICKICLDDGTKGTGFFCKIPLPDKNHLLPVLITNNHVINEKYLKEKKFFNIKIYTDQNEKIILLNNKKIYTNSEFDVIIIEIKPNQEKIDYFMELDENIFKNNYNDYKEKQFIYYIVHIY